MTKIKALLCVLIVFQATEASAQKSWSDSVPRVMKIIQPYCPLKVRGVSGEWANFKESLPSGRSVVGAINPRRPDLVFFQLTRDSKFMFVGPRTCFEGEGDWNIRAQNERRGYVKPPERRNYVFGSFDFLHDRPRLVSTDNSAEAIDLKSRIMGSCVGFGMDKRSGEHWYYGGSGCLGAGRGQYRVLETDESVYGDASFALYGNARITAYYDFLTLPFAVGAEGSLGFWRARYKTGILNFQVSPQFALSYGFALGWRFYFDKIFFTPKIHFNKFHPRTAGLELQLAYVFGGN